jgi:hypothetical protein
MEICSRRMRWAGYIERRREMRNIKNIFGNSVEKETLGRPRSKYEGYIKIDIK